MSSLPILAILILTFVLGGLVIYQFLPLGTRANLGLIFAALLIGSAITGWIALVLAEFNVYSLPNFLGVWSLFILVFGGLSYFKRRKMVRLPEPPTGTPSRFGGKWQNLIEYSLLGVWLLAASWLFFRPHEYIMGGADAGVYVSLGSEIAQNGGFQITDDALAGINADLLASFLRPLPRNPVASSYLFPGFYVTDAQNGGVTPQFYPLHPVWQAVAFSLSGSVTSGVRAELLMPGLWMTFATLAIYFIVRELLGRLPAFIVLFALSITALQVWFGRYPTTEALTQFFIWAGLWAFILWFGDQRPKSLWAFITGIMFGSVFLVRIDVIILLPLFVILIIYLWIRGWRQVDWWFAIPFSLLVIQSFAHAMILSGPYFYELMGFGFRLLWANWWIILALVILGLLGVWGLKKYRNRLVALERYKTPLAITIIILILAYAVFGWFIRPNIGSARLFADPYSETILTLSNHQNWLRLGWYLSPFGIWFGVLGSCYFVWRFDGRTVMIWVVGLLFSAIYLWNVRANPHHVYVMRRYVPVVVPFFIVTTTIFLGSFLHRLKRGGKESPKRVSYGLSIGAGFLLLLWLFGLGWSARGFITQVDHQGVLFQIEKIDTYLDPHSVLLFNDQSPVGLGDFWGTPLKYIFGHDVFVIRDLEGLADQQLAEIIKDWRYNGRSVVWIGDPDWLHQQGFSYQQTTMYIESQRLESNYERKPQAIVPISWTFMMALVE